MATFDAQDIRESIGRFRVLIVGRANAGKTTILQRVCKTKENPEIYDTKGKKIDAAVLKSSIKRGNHDIAREMVFKSNPGFVFHDSCGFEAGSDKEFENMKKFISERANATKLEERIHAIWYCIPMDEPSRTFQRAEEKFFSECDTGYVPVVAVFTKFDALRPVAFGKIKKQVTGLPEEERSRRIAQCVEEVFTNTGVLDRLYDPENRARPKSHVRLEKMNHSDTNCDTLLECTTLALDSEELRLCLVLTQQSNVELCINCAIETLVDRPHGQLFSLPTDHEVYQYDIAKWFPYLKLSRLCKCLDGLYSLTRADDADVLLLLGCWQPYRHTENHEEETEETNNVPEYNDKLINAVRAKKEDIIRILQPLATNTIIQTGIATIIVLGCSAVFPDDNSKQDLHIVKHVKSIVDNYLKSPTAVVQAEDFTKEISRQGYKKEDLKNKILEFILKNRMSKTAKDLAAKK